jgi:hypothetical protein
MRTQENFAFCLKSAAYAEPVGQLDVSSRNGGAAERSKPDSIVASPHVASPAGGRARRASAYHHVDDQLCISLELHVLR